MVRLDRTLRATKYCPLAMDALSGEPPMNGRRRSRLEFSGTVGSILLIVNVLALACDMAPGTESPEEALERTLIELRGEERPIEAEPDSTPGPRVERGPSAIPPPASDTPSRISGGAAALPTHTPYEIAPSIANRSEVQRALVSEYPRVLRDAGVGGTALLHMFINAAGVLENALLAETSGYAQLDQAALRVADAFEFVPAQNDGEEVAVWIQVPITFQASR